VEPWGSVPGGAPGTEFPALSVIVTDVVFRAFQLSVTPGAVGADCEHPAPPGTIEVGFAVKSKLGAGGSTVMVSVAVAVSPPAPVTVATYVVV
jgi:hypothetical protein